MTSVGTRVSDSTCITGQNPLNKDYLRTTGALWADHERRLLFLVRLNGIVDRERGRLSFTGYVARDHERHTEVAKRLGIMSEGERPQGSGPILVKG